MARDNQKERKETTIHGFDTFYGLPEDWRGTKAGSYSMNGMKPFMMMVTSHDDNDTTTNNISYHVG